MRLVTTDRGIGRLRDDRVELLDLPHADLGALLRDGGVAAAAAADVRADVRLGEVTVLAPIPRPGKLILVGLNSHSHVAEIGFDRPDRPVWMIAPPSAVIAPGATIHPPALAPGSVDYEAELALVIGAGATQVSAADGDRYIAGLTAANDVTARELLIRSFGDPTLDPVISKSFDTFKPLGPALATPDEFADFHDVRLRTRVNGELRQDARTGADHIFSFGELLEAITAVVTLEPGDVVLTGSPEGVGMSRGAFLTDGDVVEVEIDGIGVLRSPVGSVARGNGATIGMDPE